MNILALGGRNLKMFVSNSNQHKARSTVSIYPGEKNEVNLKKC